MRGGGGLAGRRAMVRWALRMFRREWRQQILILALLTVAVAAGTVGESAAFNMAPLAEGDFGSASHRLRLDRPEPGALAADVAAAQSWFGTIDVITHRPVPVAGATGIVLVRAQDPDGPLAARMLRLVAGRYPSGGGEVAVTRHVATLLGAGIGATADLGGSPRTVVGLVENPAELADQFALEAPSTPAGRVGAFVLVRTTDDRIAGFRLADGSQPPVERRRHTERTAAAVGGFGAAAVLFLLISLVAAAGFAVVAQRRLRQLGMLAAIGATKKQLRLVMVANGALVGAMGAVLGTAAGFAAWMIVAPRLEAGAGHRIDRLDLPWSVLGLGVLMAVVVATGSAWWPARSVTRIPVAAALSARVPRPRSVRRSAAAAAVLLAAGFIGLDAGIDPVSDRGNPVAVIAGIVAIVGGLVMVSPSAIRAVASLAGRTPVATRIALRDLGRYQARSAAALAAISLSVGIAVAVVLSASAAVATGDEGNLSDRQLLFRLGNSELVADRPPVAVQAMQADVQRFGSTLDRATVVGLDVAVDPAVRETMKGVVLRPAVSLGRRVSAETTRFVGLLYVASPQLLGHLGLGDRQIDPATDVLTVHRGALAYVNGPRGSPPPSPRIEPIALPTYSAAPTSLITQAGLRRAGWQAQPAGWLVQAASPLSATQVRAARELAAAAGMTVESRDEQRSLSAVRTGATAAGALLALGVLAMTVGLIRSESAPDLRALAATGASSRARRTITASTAGALGFLGVVLGTATAYGALIGGYSGSPDGLGPPPVLHLLVTIVGVPVVAALAGWLLSGREPPALARPAFE